MAITLGSPPHLETGDSQLPPYPGLSSLPLGQELVPAGSNVGGHFPKGPPGDRDSCSQSPPFLGKKGQQGPEGWAKEE